MVATVWEAGRGMHWTAKSWAKTSVKSRKIRGIKIAPTATCVKGNCKGCHSCCMEIILIYYLVKMLTGSQYFEIFKQHILQQSRVFQVTESHHSSHLPESELEPPLNFFLYTFYFKCGTELKGTPEKMEVALTWNVWYFRRKTGRLTVRTINRNTLATLPLNQVGMT